MKGPNIEIREQFVERQIEQIQTVQRTVRGPRIQKRIIQQPRGKSPRRS